MKGKYKRFMAWCPACDQALVAGGKKCPVCGHRMPAGKLKGEAAIRAETEREVE